jgi:uncharacterized protein YdhG (YjbR/CyaY superfamily)
MKPAQKGMQDPGKGTAVSKKSKGVHGRGKSRDEGARPRAEGPGGRGKRRAREDCRDARTGSRHGQATPPIVKASAPDLPPKPWYGMPAYAKDDKVICHFQDARKFKTRYATLGFSDKANLDDGAMLPVAFALKGLTAAEEARIAALVKKAVSQGPRNLEDEGLGR